MLVYSNLIGSPSGDKGNLCTYAQLILTRDGLKKEGRLFSGPKSLDVHRRGRRCSYSKAVKRWVRCDPRHSNRHGTRPARGGLSYGTYYYPRLGDWFTGPDNDRRWDLIWGLIDLFRQEVRAPLKSYGGAISMICGGVAMLGVAQLLRAELVLILMHAH